MGRGGAEQTRRIAAVQHGDYPSAVSLISAGHAEPYFGMKYSLDTLGRLFGSSPHLVVSLDAAPHRLRSPPGEFVGLPCPRLPRIAPRSIAAHIWGRRIVRELARFRPTHILLRTAGIPAIHVLRFCDRHQISTAVVFASHFSTARRRGRSTIRRLVSLLNRPFVELVGNHKQPATDSMIECGVDPSKCVAWDWPATRDPRDHAPKRLSEVGVRDIVYVGTMSNAKGVADLIDAVALLNTHTQRLRLTLVGDGPDLEVLRARAARHLGLSVEFTGRVGNEEAFRRMRACTVACVPSRHEFTEGMPLTLTEALASRTPTAISDHPVFRRAFVEGEGVRSFKAGDAQALASTLASVLADAEDYARLSTTTEAAFRRVECRRSFGDLLTKWVT